MDVKVITRHGPSNYGSLLQSIATIKILESLGHKATIIDYQRKDERGYGIVKCQLKNKPQYSNLLKSFIYTIVRYPIEKFAQIRFDRMRTRLLVMTHRVINYAQLKEIKADVFLTGSDQVWGPTMNGQIDPAYFLEFVSGNIPKVAYAASFGKTQFDKQTEDDYTRMLSKYSAITVREKSAVEIIQSWGLDNCLGQVLDPTLLLDKNQWKEVLGLDKRKAKRKRKYILLYLIHNYPEHAAYARSLSKKMNLPIVRINPFFHQKRLGEKFHCCPDVSCFVSLVENATFMVTDSFHGTCFAINFNVQFVDLLPQNGTSTRNLSVLELTGLTNRIVKDNKDIDWEENLIDYERVEDILIKERIKSVNFLKTIVFNTTIQ